MNEEKISVIIPVYNVEPYLERCLNSVLRQTYSALQIILVDDGSLDGSGRICDRYQEQDSRISVIHKRNGGLADARNAGLKLATGMYVGFVDSDDYIAEDMYESLYLALKMNGASVACCGRYDIYEKEGKIRKQKNFVQEEEICYHKTEALKALCLYDGMDFSACDKLFDRRIFEGLQFPKGRSSEDIPVVYQLYRRADLVVHIGSAKYYYCHRGDSITGQEFNVCRLDYLRFIYTVYKDIAARYPRILREAEGMLFQATAVMWYLVKETGRTSHNYILLEGRLRKWILLLFLRGVFNPYINKGQNQRIVAELLRYGAVKGRGSKRCRC